VTAVEHVCVCVCVCVDECVKIMTIDGYPTDNRGSRSNAKS
jgi:hypothetical protein